MEIMKSLFSTPEFIDQVLGWYHDIVSVDLWKALAQITGDYFITCGER